MWNRFNQEQFELCSTYSQPIYCGINDAVCENWELSVNTVRVSGNGVSKFFSHPAPNFATIHILWEFIDWAHKHNSVWMCRGGRLLCSLEITFIRFWRRTRKNTVRNEPVHCKAARKLLTLSSFHACSGLIWSNVRLVMLQRVDVILPASVSIWKPLLQLCVSIWNLVMPSHTSLKSSHTTTC